MAQKDDGLDLSGVTRKHLEDEITRQLQTDFKYKGNISGLPGSGQKDQEKEMVRSFSLFYICSSSSSSERSQGVIKVNS